MFSNLASYIFGRVGDEEAEDSGPAATPQPLIITSSSDVAAPQPAMAVQVSPQSSEDDEDWVLVGGGARAPALGSLNEPLPRPPLGSTGSSASPSESGEMEEEAVEDGNDEDEGEGEEKEKDDEQPPAPISGPPPRGRSGGFSRRMVAAAYPHCCNSVAAAALPQLKALRSAQTSKHRREGVGNTAKAAEKRNKAVKNNRGTRTSKRAHAARSNLALKAAGGFNLKQC